MGSSGDFFVGFGGCSDGFCLVFFRVAGCSGDFFQKKGTSRNYKMYKGGQVV